MLLRVFPFSVHACLCTDVYTRLYTRARVRAYTNVEGAALLDSAVYGHVYRHACIGMSRDMCRDMSVDICIHMRMDICMSKVLRRLIRYLYRP